jgi:hypothetical protein
MESPPGDTHILANDEDDITDSTRILPVGVGEVGEGEEVFAGVGMVATSGNWGRSMPAISPSWERTWAASGWAKMVRIDAATISAEAFGTLASTFLIQWTRQRCHDEPTNTDPIADLRPR